MANSGNITPPHLFPSIDCVSKHCSHSDVCCGEDPYDQQFYCMYDHCSCSNRTSVHEGVGCWCDEGYHGDECEQQIPPTMWLAVILTVGTVMILFIAWGFRCGDGDDAYADDVEERRRSGRTPLLREEADRAVAAARPPSTCRPTVESTSDASCTGPGSGETASLQRRTCCVCLVKPLQVVLIPCGHACVCRKCSRRLDTCPLCRLEIQATQRFYF